MTVRATDPLVPRFHACVLPELRAGTASRARLELENAGSATWRSFGGDGLQLSHHWLDRRGNAIVWDGPRTPFPRPLAPGERISLDVGVVAPRPPGAYVLRFDLVEEHRFWLSEVGVDTLDVEVTVAARIDERRLAVVVHGGADTTTAEALAALDEPVVDDDPVAVAHLVAGARPAPDWSRRLLDAHAEGWAAVGPALVPDGTGLSGRRAARSLAAWAPAGRNPRFARPLLLPSLLVGLEPTTEEHGLPAFASGEDALFEGRALVRLPTRSGRPLR